MEEEVASDPRLEVLNHGRITVVPRFTVQSVKSSPIGPSKCLGQILGSILPRLTSRS